MKSVILTEQTTPINSPVLNRTEAAQFLKISLSTLVKETQAGRIPCQKIGRRCLYSVDKLREFFIGETEKA